MIHANKIATFAKDIAQKAYYEMCENEIDFLGASEPYIQEKLNAAIESLKFLKRCVKNTSQKQEQRERLSERV